MGCGASNNNGDSSNDSTKKDETRTSNETTKKDDPSSNKYKEEDDDEDMEDIVIRKKVITVITTGNRKASSTISIPKLAATGAFVPTEEDGEERAANKKQPQDREREEKAKQMNFVFGDFEIDPQDVQQQRLERFQRVARTNEDEARVLKRRTSSEKNAAHPASSPKAAKAATVTRTGAVFMLNDFVVSVDNEDELERSLHAAQEAPVLEMDIPNFKPLKGYSCSNFLGHTARVKAVAVSPDERAYLSSSIEDQAISLFGMSGEELNCIFGHQGALISLTFSKDGKFFASSSRDLAIVIWDSSQSRESSVRRQVRWFDGDLGGGSVPICTAFSHNCSHLVAGYQDRHCRVWDINKSSVCGVFGQHQGVVVCIATHPKEPIAASGASDRTIFLWGIPNCQVHHTLQGHEGAIISVNFSPDGEQLLSNDDRACRIWSTTSGALLQRVNVQDIAQITKPIDFKATGAFGDEAKSDASSAQRSHSAEPYWENVRYALDGKNTLGTANSAAAQSSNSQRVAFTVSCLCPGSLSHSYFAVACTDRNIYLVNASNGRPEAVIPTKAPVFAISAGRLGVIIFGDTYGNVYRLVLRS